MLRRILFRIAAHAISSPEVVEELNRKLDLPGLDEAAEAELIQTILDTLAAVLRAKGAKP